MVLEGKSGNSIQTNQQELTGVLWEIPEACQGTEHQSEGSKVKPLVDLKAIEESHPATSYTNTHTHPLEEPIVCAEVVNEGGSGYCPCTLRSDLFMSHLISDL